MADRILDRIRLRDLRESQLMTQAGLAEAANVSVRTVIYAEVGPVTPTGIVLNKLAKALGVTVADLLVESVRDKDAA